MISFLVGVVLIVIFAVGLRIFGLVKVCIRMLDSSKAVIADLMDATKSDAEKEQAARSGSFILLTYSGVILLRLAGVAALCIIFGWLCVIARILDSSQIFHSLSDWKVIVMGSVISVLVFLR